MIAILKRVDDLTPNIKTFWFEPEKPLRYEAGQFTELYLPHAGHDDRGERRWFTLSSSPTEALLAITTRFVVCDGSTFKQQLQRLPLGSKVTLADPMGDFILPKDISIPLIFAAAGIGVTPVRSIVKYVHDTNQHRNIRVLYGVRNPSEFIFAEAFNRYGVPPMVFVSGTSKNKEKGLSRMSADVLAHATDRPDALIYLSGPKAFSRQLALQLQRGGIPQHRIIIDVFPGYASSF